MGTIFEVDVERLMKLSNDIDQSSQELFKSGRELEETKADILAGVGGGAYSIQLKLALDIMARRANKNADSVSKLGTTLATISQQYGSTEQDIINYQSGLVFAGIAAESGDVSGNSSGGSGSHNGTEITGSPVYGTPPKYGGDQGNPKKIAEKRPSDEFNEAYSWLLNIFPEMTEDEAAEMMVHANTVGCGYIAMCNSVFQEFANKQDKFKEIFGFDYLDNSGNPNINRMFLEMYAYAKRDGINICNDSTDTARYGWPMGTTPETRMDIINNYFKDKDISVKTSDKVKLTPKDMEKYIKKGKHLVIDSITDPNPDGSDNRIKEVLYNMDGTKAKDVGNHCMSITGVTDDGYIIVSSWGKQYKMKISDFDSNERYQIFDFKY